jgi:hypothetical protein
MQSDLSELKREYRRRARRQLITTVLMLPAMFVVLLAGPGGGIDAIWGVSLLGLLPGAVGVLIAGFAFSARNWCCPACAMYLRNQINPRFCPGCGAQFRD